MIREHEKINILNSKVINRENKIKQRIMSAHTVNKIRFPVSKIGTCI